MRRTPIVLLAALLATALAGSGCAVFLVGGGAAIGGGSVAYVTGELKATEEAPLAKVWDATDKAMKELEFKPTLQQKDAVSARIVARTAADKKVEVNLARVTDKLTEVRVRVGTFGDESLSRLILQKIQKGL
jgi:hypothetical protein